MNQQRLKSHNILKILKKNEKIISIKDVDSLLDRVLFEARAITNADAGSIYLLKGDRLTFEYVQNDTLSKKNRNINKYIYAKQEIEINNNSISGYVALNRKPLLIDNVYNLEEDVSYTFNRSFDQSSSYHTQSMLTVPLITSRNKITGVLQIINAKNNMGEVIPFSGDDELLVSLFANQAAVAIERAKMTRDVILRMIKIAELRDPLETSLHVNRVGAYSIEIYQQWATKKNIPDKDIKKIKDILRIAAMLHDVGKVAISDTILKKPKRLNLQEYDHMKLHTVFGARLFSDSNSDWDDMATEITLNHHERWDGTGYPGPVKNIFNDRIPMKKGKKGEEIPIYGRIVALADVYDALISKRSYKKSWDEQKTLNYIVFQKNKHFDPDVVDAFIEIYDIIKAIQGKYSNS